MRSICLRTPTRSQLPASTAIWLAPETLLGERELEHLSRRARANAGLRALIDRMKAALQESGDVATLYVYPAGTDLYEIDWELTETTEASVQALALAAQETGRKLTCRLVPPKARRTRTVTTSTIVVGEPATYGQLQLEI